jgi:hypothetical protein
LRRTHAHLDVKLFELLIMFHDHLLDVLVDGGVRPHMFVLAIADGKVLFVNDVGIQAPLVGDLLVAKGWGQSSPKS